MVPPALWFALASVAQRVVARRRVSLMGAVAAAPMLAASGALGFAGVDRFRRFATTVDPMRPEAAASLVTDGPYRFTRNPMYVALAGVLVAHALARRSVTALLPVAGFVAILDRTQILDEEAALAARFGDDFHAYRRLVPRWLGRVAASG